MNQKIQMVPLSEPPPDLRLLFNQFKNAIPENNSGPENVMQSKYYDTY